MPESPLPISSYVDPEWYTDLVNYNSNLAGPERPQNRISPLGARTLIDPTDPQRGKLPDPNFNAVRDVNDFIRLSDANQLIKNRALESKNKETNSLNYFKKNYPKEYTYTTDIKKLKDRMVLRLYSPDSRSNPGFNTKNRDQKLATDIIDWSSKKLSEGGGFVQDLANKVGLGEITGSVGNYLNKGATTVKNVLSPNAIAEAGKKFEFLNESFYDRGSEGNRYKIIYLPMPRGQLVDSHAHTINGVAMNPALPLASLAASALNSAIPGGSTSGSSRGIGARGYSIPGGVGEYIMNAAQLNSRKAINPAQETLYQSPVPRQFQFEFGYAPTSKEEADNFIQIVDILKQHSYPTVDAEAVLFNFPGTVDFYFVTNSMIDEDGDIDEDRPENKVLPKSYHPCFIKSVQIDYISETGFYSHFYDGNPTFINLTLELVETKLLTREDLDPLISDSSPDLTPEQKKEQLLNPPPSFSDNARLT